MTSEGQSPSDIHCDSPSRPACRPTTMNLSFKKLKQITCYASQDPKRSLIKRRTRMSKVVAKIKSLDAVLSKKDRDYEQFIMQINNDQNCLTGSNFRNLRDLENYSVNEHIQDGMTINLDNLNSSSLDTLIQECNIISHNILMVEDAFEIDSYIIDFVIIRFGELLMQSHNPLLTDSIFSVFNALIDVGYVSPMFYRIPIISLYKLELVNDDVSENILKFINQSFEQFHEHYLRNDVLKIIASDVYFYNKFCVQHFFSISEKIFNYSEHIDSRLIQIFVSALTTLSMLEYFQKEPNICPVYEILCQIMLKHKLFGLKSDVYQHLNNIFAIISLVLKYEIDFSRILSCFTLFIKNNNKFLATILNHELICELNKKILSEIKDESLDISFVNDYAAQLLELLPLAKTLSLEPLLSVFENSEINALERKYKLRKISDFSAHMLNISLKLHFHSTTKLLLKNYAFDDSHRADDLTDSQYSLARNMEAISSFSDIIINIISHPCSDELFDKCLLFLSNTLCDEQQTENTIKRQFSAVFSRLEKSSRIDIEACFRFLLQMLDSYPNIMIKLFVDNNFEHKLHTLYKNLFHDNLRLLISSNKRSFEPSGDYLKNFFLYFDWILSLQYKHFNTDSSHSHAQKFISAINRIMNSGQLNEPNLEIFAKIFVDYQFEADVLTSYDICGNLLSLLVLMEKEQKLQLFLTAVSDQIHIKTISDQNTNTSSPFLKLIRSCVMCIDKLVSEKLNKKWNIRHPNLNTKSIEIDKCCLSREAKIILSPIVRDSKSSCPNNFKNELILKIPICYTIKKIEQSLRSCLLKGSINSVKLRHKSNAINRRTKPKKIQFFMNDVCLPESMTLLQLIFLQYTSNNPDIFACQDRFEDIVGKLCQKRIRLSYLKGTDSEINDYRQERSLYVNGESLNIDMPYRTDIDPITKYELLLRKLYCIFETFCPDKMYYVCDEFYCSRISRCVQNLMNNPHSMYSGNLLPIGRFVTDDLCYLIDLKTRKSMIDIATITKGYKVLNDYLQNSYSDIHFEKPKFRATINRNNILSDSKILFTTKYYQLWNSTLEVQFVDEIGFGLGPTLEFYDNLSREVHNLRKFWLDISSLLHPIPKNSVPNLRKSKSFFKFIGQLVAKSLVDGKLINIPLSIPFIKSLLSQSQSIHYIKYLDEEVYYNFMKIKNDNLEQIGLYFENPFTGIAFDESCENVVVDETNYSNYEKKLVDDLFGSGIQYAISSFTEGFRMHCSLRILYNFTPHEFLSLISDSRKQTSITKSEFENYVKFSNGYTLGSKTVQYMFEYIESLNSEKFCKLIKFITGSSRLPNGGIKNLNPHLKISKRNSLTPDCDLPSVMTCTNSLKLPQYSSLEILKSKFHISLNHCSETFYLS
ncbi:MAG: Ubiquitin-protein ligase [Marteilia pararefringens]